MTGGRVRFGVFEADLSSGEVRKDGLKVRLQGQPFEVLTQLLSRPGEVVTREELREHLWPSDVFVDFDQGLNKAINRIREVLGDSADSPRFVETLPRRGYRFIAPVERLDRPSAPASPPGTPEAPTPKAPPRGSRKRWWLIAAAAAMVAFPLVWTTRPWGAARGARSMLVVLPFQNLSGSPGQDYFSDGLTEEMIAQLGSLDPRRLGVIARTSALQYRGSRKTAADVARELKVEYILEGSVRRDADRVRITAQLIQAADQSQLWAQSYERGPEGVLAIQSEVARSIAASLALELLPARQHALSHPATDSSVAHDAYLRGRYLWNKRTEDGLRRSLDAFQEAVAADSRYAPGHAGLADAYNVLADYAILSPGEAAPQAEAAARRALALDPNLAEAHAALAYSRWNFSWDAREAEESYRRAIEINPGYAAARQWYASYLGQLGRFDEAFVQIRQAEALDPLSLIIPTNAGALHYFARRYDAAVRECQRTLARDEQFTVALWLLALSHEAGGRYPQALAAIDKAISASDGDPTFRAARGHILAASGNEVAARAILGELLELRQKRFISSYEIALLHGALGERAQALDWLDQAFAQRSNALADLRVDPRLDPLRSEPRFQALVRRVGLP